MIHSTRGVAALRTAPVTPAAGPEYVIETKPVSRKRIAGPATRVEQETAPPAEDHNAERSRLAAALHECGGNKAQAARLLGLPRSTYFSKLKKYGLSA